MCKTISTFTCLALLINGCCLGKKTEHEWLPQMIQHNRVYAYIALETRLDLEASGDKTRTAVLKLEPILDGTASSKASGKVRSRPTSRATVFVL